MDIKKYQKVSSDIWGIFKKHLPADADLGEFTADVSELDRKYKDTDEYLFMQKLLKVYFDELNRMKG
jgi:hypothetical protein